MPKKNNRKKNNLSRYNIFQKELSNYIKETGGSKYDYKKYKSLYSQIGKDVPVKAFPVIIGGLITKNVVKDVKHLKYTESFPFYNARAELLTPKFTGIKIKIKFDDGGLKLDWEGDAFEFQSWFSGDIIAYFRNNYNDSPVAEFVLKDGNEQSAEYEIQVEGSLVGTKGYVPAGSDFLSKSSLPEKGSQVPSEDTERLKLRESILNKEMELIDKKLKLIEKLEGLGFSKEEIREQLKRI